MKNKEIKQKCLKMLLKYNTWVSSYFQYLLYCGKALTKILIQQQQQQKCIKKTLKEKKPERQCSKISINIHK